MLSLSAAQAAIRTRITTCGTETVSLAEALYLVSAASVCCSRPIPHFSAAAMDGYALGPIKDGRYIIKAETAAGDTTCRFLRAGEAVRIMTGALLPSGTERVVPFELTKEDNNELSTGPLPRNKFIQPQGGELSRGRVIIRRGERVNTSHLIYLSADGQENIRVYKAPRAAFFCTGSELTTESRPPAGKRRNSNNLLLAALIRRAGAVPLDLGLAADTPEALRAALRRGIAADEQTILISTGGMGPGKYDLTKAIFKEMGGEVIFDHLSLRPGKGTLCGRLDNLLYFALPGPPMAVNTIFPLLVSPALRQAQGLKKAWPLKATAVLSTEIRIRKPEFTHLKGGVISYKGGRLMVREARTLEEAGVVMVIPARRRLLRVGQLVGVFSE
ncbi:MAG TPA: molybdopterin molybdenumtransferase MoeA [Desulfobacterales bacterium]|nr:molybdopterin molybdenumtransferase MoeA [Desulfobacterales bacterium]